MAIPSVSLAVKHPPPAEPLAATPTLRLVPWPCLSGERDGRGSRGGGHDADNPQDAERQPHPAAHRRCSLIPDGGKQAAGPQRDRQRDGQEHHTSQADNQPSAKRSTMHREVGPEGGKGREPGCVAGLADPESFRRRGSPRQAKAAHTANATAETVIPQLPVQGPEIFPPWHGHSPASEFRSPQPPSRIWGRPCIARLVGPGRRHGLLEVVIGRRGSSVTA